LKDLSSFFVNQFTEAEETLSKKQRQKKSIVQDASLSTLLVSSKKSLFF
jgi:hypothetical protein